MLFNSALGDWNTSSAQSFYRAFYGASNFDSSLGGFKMGLVNNVDGMLSGTGLNVVNYEDTLDGWGKQKLKSSLTFGAWGLKYSTQGDKPRNVLISKYQWNVVGDKKI